MNVRTVVIAVLVLALIGALVVVPIVLISSMQRNTERVLAPIEEANQALKTQVSELLNPTPTIIPDPVSIIHEVRSLARLETIQYSVEKVITAEVGQDAFSFLFGDKLLFVAHGTVIAGVDLAKLEDADLELQGTVLRVHMPAPEVFVATLNNDQSYIYDRETGLLRQEVVDLETQARQVAESEILRTAMEDGILPQARDNAEVYLIRLFNALGYSEVIFEWEPLPAE